MTINNKFHIWDEVKITEDDDDPSLIGTVHIIDLICQTEHGIEYHLVGFDKDVPECNLDLAKPPIEKHVCSKCGKVTEYRTDEFDFRANECWSINVGRAGYGSKFDGCDIYFKLCDDCLYELVSSFTVEGQEEVHNSGSNTYLSREEWIKLYKGEMTDEEMEECGLISNRQRQVYYERYPVCSCVNIYEYNDGSKASRCHCSVWGNEEGDAGNYCNSTRCFGCGDFKIRTDGEAVPVIHPGR